MTTTWRDDAACRDSGAEGFFPDSSDPREYDAPRAVCRRCTVRQECLADQLAWEGSIDTGDRTGWATALKPGFEPIVLARKPVERTVASNAAAYGTGALHVDACRLPTTDSLGGGSNAKGRVMSTDGWTRPWMADAVAAAASASRSRASTARSEALGRWPANVVLDERQADILDQQAPGASRFYYAAKPGTAERPRVDGVSHPSVKPLALMRWLIRLVTPAGGVVLDPFAGSGATVEACLLESRRCIAIERDLSFLPLIEHRLTRQADLLRTESESA